jgi:hypothetical protein
VTLIAGSLQRAGLIEYSRGRVKILNREDLESAACDCYKIVKALFTNLYRHEALSNGQDESSKVAINPANGRARI